ncbi:DUF6686 family protein [Runella sp.]|uniref:DUF6686 family protein n=1 Tax=Runella sp. TaxID=1960881 RepID=UPI003D13B0D4
MTHQHPFKTLLEKDYGYVGVCESCKMYHIAYKNFMFCLDETEFEWFRQLLVEKKMVETFSTPHGKELIHYTPLSNFYLLFSYSEMDELLTLMNEISMTVEARKMLKNIN